MARDFTCRPCSPVRCDNPFDRVAIFYTIRSGAKVAWELLSTFLDPMPYTFQLQVGQNPNNNADDWEDVGLPVVNSYVAIDGEQRVWGKTQWTHYRVQLTTSLGSYVSDPVNVLGTLEPRDWRLAREIIRKEKLVHRLGSQKGYLLKRRVTGQKCSHCLDFQTEEVRDSGCPSCYGTGFECGYFFPMDCIYANMQPRSRRIELDAAESRATVNDVVVPARMAMTELLNEDDVWVNDKTDDRYFVHRVKHLAEMRGVPLIGEVELRLIPFSSPIYEIEIPQQLLNLET